jgi:sulfite reductase alpha subunit-like flavoprotein
LVQFQKDGVLTELHTAFSRDQETKVYVQHLLKQQGEETWKLLDEGKAHIYVCGAVKMGHDVCEVLREIITKGVGGSAKEGNK